MQDECQEQLSDCQGDGESNLDLSFEVEFKARDIEPRKMARRDDEGREAGLSLGPGPFIPNAGLTPGFTTNSSTSLGANDTVPASTNTTLYMNMTLVTNATTDAYYSTADPYATPDSDPDVSVVGAYYQARYTTVDPYIAQGAYATLTPTTPANIDPTSTSDPTIETDQRLPSADPSESTPPPPPPPPPVDAPGDQDGGEHGKETSEYRTHHDIVSPTVILH